MRMSAKLLLVVALASPIAAYAQDAGSQTAAVSGNTSGQSTVYVYRYKQFEGSALSPSVFCDDGQLARMENGRFFVVHIAPGRHSFRSNDAQSGIELDAKAGEKYFIRVEIVTGMMKGHGRLVLTPSEQGSYELKSKHLKALDADKVTDKTRVSVEGLFSESSENKSAETK